MNITYHVEYVLPLTFQIIHLDMHIQRSPYHKCLSLNWILNTNIISVITQFFTLLFYCYYYYYFIYWKMIIKKWKNDDEKK